MSKPKILFVDDEVDFSEIIGSRIKSWGYDLIAVSSGKESLEALASKSPDIIILDYMMPDMNGVEVLREIRKIAKDIPVIMFTAYPDSQIMQEAKELQVSAFIPKLSKYVDIQSALRNALNIVGMRLPKKE